MENIPRSTIKEMATLFDVNPCYIMGFSNDSNPPKGEATVYDRVTIELGTEACDLLQNFAKMNQKGRDTAFATVNALSSLPENTTQEKTRLKNA